MTISICWQRKFRGVDEIIFASDSRLSAGYRWDCAQKIFPIEGPNFCISFAGNSDFAFPCIFQFQRMVKSYERFSTGAAPISVLAKDFLAIVNQLFALVDDKIIAQFNQTQFLLGGYDFETGEPYLRSIRFDEKSAKYKRFEVGGLSSGGLKAAVGFAGDLRSIYLGTLGKTMDRMRSEMDYQPLSALQEVLQQQGRDSPVGGKPQIVKVYKHRNYLPYAVRESQTSKDHYLFGRPLLAYEKVFYPVATLDCIGESNFVHYPRSTPNRKLSKPLEIHS
ncbi:hypothetical protein [Rhizobium leguminosarum]|uniref:hypothetical protein n=2 Tax=Rhizobium leguminosarum TaxID=384 RepID=UPI000480A91C|nr:hypothetical protein [Rhizobium leguminosarum]TBZ54231.1 hypothetical protein E0H42_14415 [Rhizobium leguminosarum bv. viciae]